VHCGNTGGVFGGDRKTTTGDIEEGGCERSVWIARGFGVALRRWSVIDTFL
jgi:hypothetical protein